MVFLGEVAVSYERDTPVLQPLCYSPGFVRTHQIARSFKAISAHPAQCFSLGACHLKRHLSHQKQPPPLGPPQDPRYGTTVRS